MNESKVLNETTNLVADNSQEQKKEVATSETTNVDEKNLAKNSPTQEDTKKEDAIDLKFIKESLAYDIMSPQQYLVMNIV